jgi:hypothetical protein
VTDFERAWLDSGRLLAPWGSPELIDVAEGRWRALRYARSDYFPPVHPHHERRKYLFWEGRPSPADAAGLSPAHLPASSATAALPRLCLAKFAGLGRHGAAALKRAQLLAEAGFGPPALGLQNGFLISQFVPGQPVQAGEAGPALVERMAQYLAYVQRRFVAEQAVAVDELLEMIRVNVSKGLGPAWLPPGGWGARFRAAVQNRPAVALDARMLPHEWLAAGAAYLKTDGLDHHRDHFFPGLQDAAWDIAGTGIEFGLSRGAFACLRQRYQALARDPALPAVLPFYRVAYLAFRLGYTRLAADTLANSAERPKFQALSQRYAACLRRELQPARSAKGR